MLDALATEGFTPEQIAEIALARLVGLEMACIPEVRATKAVQPKPLAQLSNGCVRLRVSVGRNQRVAPNHIVAAITDATGISGKRIGKIQCYGDYSLVEVPDDLARRIVSETAGTPIGGVTADLRLYQEGPRHENRTGRGGYDRSRREGHRGGKPYGNHRNGAGRRKPQH